MEKRWWATLLLIPFVCAEGAKSGHLGILIYLILLCMIVVFVGAIAVAFTMLKPRNTSLAVFKEAVRQKAGISCDVDEELGYNREEFVDLKIFD